MASIKRKPKPEREDGLPAWFEPHARVSTWLPDEYAAHHGNDPGGEVGMGLLLGARRLHKAAMQEWVVESGYEGIVPSARPVWD